MSWHEDFYGDEGQFDDYVGIWHEDNCGAKFVQWNPSTAWYRCTVGHVYRSDGHMFWCHPFMRGSSLMDMTA